jgi:hypothetical protein
LLFLAMLEHPLDHAATIRMSGKRIDLPMESVNDELNMRTRDTLNSLSR